MGKISNIEFRRIQFKTEPTTTEDALRMGVRRKLRMAKIGRAWHGIKARAASLLSGEEKEEETIEAA